jgi:hypothetical protein
MSAVPDPLARSCTCLNVRHPVRRALDTERGIVDRCTADTISVRGVLAHGDGS